MRSDSTIIQDDINKWISANNIDIDSCEVLQSCMANYIVISIWYNYYKQDVKLEVMCDTEAFPNLS